MLQRRVGQNPPTVVTQTDSHSCTLLLLTAIHMLLNHGANLDFHRTASLCENISYLCVIGFKKNIVFSLRVKQPGVTENCEVVKVI